MKTIHPFSRFWLPLLVVSCGADYIDFREQPLKVDSPSERAEEEGAAGAENSGGTGGQLSGPSRPLLPGGYAGGFPTLGDPSQGAHPECQEQQGVGLFIYDTKTCKAGTLCALPCETQADCHLGTMHPEHGWIEAEGQCLGTDYGQRCRLLCETDAQCPQGMTCEETHSGRSCLFPDVPQAPGCDDSYCMSEGQQHAEDGSGPFYCDVDAPCCEGLSCSPSGTCQSRSCLGASWTCSESSAPCCEGLACTGGYCQTP